MAKVRKVKLASGLEIEVGSGNVYKDLGLKNADAMLARGSSETRLGDCRGTSLH